MLNELIRELIEKGSYALGVTETDFQQIRGSDFAGDPYASVKHATDVMTNTYIEPHMLKDFETFEDTLVAVLIMKLHVMIGKQADYGPGNISKAGVRGIITRGQDKLERLKTLIGDPDEQLGKLKALAESLDVESKDDTLEFYNKAMDILFPTTAVKDESVEDTALDWGNYGDILLLLLLKAWGKPLRFNA